MKTFDASHDALINPRKGEVVTKKDVLDAERLLDNAMLMAQLVDWIFTKKWTDPGIPS